MRKNAFTILEMSIVIAIIGILIVGIVTVASNVRKTALLMKAAQTVNVLHEAANGYLAIGNNNFTGITISQLQTDDLLPDGFSGTGSNPWGGNYSIAVNASDSSMIDIQITSVPTAVGSKLISMFTQSAASTPTCTDGTFTVTF